MFTLPPASETYARLADTCFRPAAFEGLSPGVSIHERDFYRTPWLAFFDLMAVPTPRSPRTWRLGWRDRWATSW